MADILPRLTFFLPSLPDIYLSRSASLETLNKSSWGKAWRRCISKLRTCMPPDAPSVSLLFADRFPTCQTPLIELHHDVRSRTPPLPICLGKASSFQDLQLLMSSLAKGSPSLKRTPPYQLACLDSRRNTRRPGSGGRLMR